MTRQDKITAASPEHVGPPSGLTGAVGQAPDTCPDCDGPFSYRIVDEDSGCRYPVDPGEHYCSRCDSLFTDEYLAGDEPVGWELAELSVLGGISGSHPTGHARFAVDGASRFDPGRKDGRP